MAAGLTADVQVRCTPGVLFTVVDETSAVLLDPEAKVYFTLNGTGLFLWETLSAAGATSARELGRALGEAFEVEPACAEADALAFVEALRAEGLVQAA